MKTLQQRHHRVLERIRNAATACERDANAIELLAVSKTRPVEDILALHALGQCAFGENYLQEALPKIAALKRQPLAWHFIGPVQSNKTRQISEHFDWLHSLDRLKIAQRLSEQRLAGQPPLNVCIQVNIDDEPSKSGVTAHQLPDLCAQISELPGLKLRGLMAIPAPSDDPHAQRRKFRAVRLLLASLTEAGFELDTLSMGMSADLEAAIAEGSTMVRIGTDIFGAR